MEYFITLNKDDTIQKQQVNKQQRAWSQSGRQHMVILVNVARFELKLHIPVKKVLAFILSDLIERKGVFACLALCRCSLIFLLCYNCLHQSAAGYVQLSIALCYNV